MKPPVSPNLPPYVSQRIRSLSTLVNTTTVPLHLTPEVDEKAIEALDCRSSGLKKRHLITLLCLCLLLWTIPLLLMIVVPTCTSASCVPQFTIQLTELSPHARELLLSGQELVKVVSYIAMDLGAYALNEAAYLDVADIFSPDQVYSLGFWGYCRVNTLDGTRFCTKAFGLDLLAVIIHDFGSQLGKLSRLDDKGVGHSFVASYADAMVFLLLFLASDSRSMTAVHSAILLRHFSRYAAWCVLVMLVLSLAVAVGGLVVCASIFIPALARVVNRYPVRLIMLGGEIGVFLLSFFVGASEYEFLAQMAKLTATMDVVILRSASGNAIIWVCTLCSFAACLLIAASDSQAYKVPSKATNESQGLDAKRPRTCEGPDLVPMVLSTGQSKGSLSA